ncbi:MAG: hypothetical protein R6V55_06840 [Desulfovermiculus sp.]
MSQKKDQSSGYRRKWRKTKNQTCHCCGQAALYCRRCRFCGCSICQQCMEDLKWGMCTPVFWLCPDCGELNSL